MSDAPKAAKLLSWLALFIGAESSFVLLLHINDVKAGPLALAGLWLLAPFGAGVAVLGQVKRPWVAWLLAIALVVVAGMAFSVSHGVTTGARRSSTESLLLIWLPIWEWMVAGIPLLLALVIPAKSAATP